MSYLLAAFAATLILLAMPAVPASMQQNTPLPSPSPKTSIEVETKQDAIGIELAAKINGFFSDRGMPLAGFGEKMVAEANLNNIDPLLLPGIAIQESTGGKFACGFNPFGWGSCKTQAFESFNEAIEVVARNLGGNNENTESFYKGKDVRGILSTYNPPSVDPAYPDKVMGHMEKIKNYEATTTQTIQKDTK